MSLIRTALQTALLTAPSRRAYTRLGSQQPRKIVASAADGVGRRDAIRTALLSVGAGPGALALPATGEPVVQAPAIAVFDVVKPVLDKRQYRGLVLPNGLRVLLVSDASTDRAAAALDVRAGYFDDPADVPGLAHFCEHMLFLGTRKYPEEGGFDSFINAAAGSNNAYTAAEDTCYFFEVDARRFDDALDRFAQFFVKDGPLFTPSATSRELNAIESEHQKNLQADSWREQQLLKMISGELTGRQHPYWKFGTGNRATLLDEPAKRGKDVRQDLLTYHGAKYGRSPRAAARRGTSRAPL